jgi:hypothetical protein
MELSNAGEFVESNKMISQILAMVAENRGVKRILGELLGADGSELVVNDSKFYVSLGEEVDFFTISMRAQLRGEICCGYQDVTGTVINPRNKSLKRRWGRCDFVVLGSANGSSSAGSGAATELGKKGSAVKHKNHAYSLKSVMQTRVVCVGVGGGGWCQVCVWRVMHMITIVAIARANIVATVHRCLLHR